MPKMQRHQRPEHNSTLFSPPPPPMIYTGKRKNQKTLCPRMNSSYFKTAYEHLRPTGGELKNDIAHLS